MRLSSDLRRAARGLWALLLGRDNATSLFRLTTGGFWRAFALAVTLAGLLGVGKAMITADSALAAGLSASAITLSVVGGLLIASLIVSGLCEMEELHVNILSFLVPLLWILMSVGTIWWTASELGMTAHNGVLPLGFLSVAGYLAWQAARIGLRLSGSTAFGVCFVWSLSVMAGYVMVNGLTMVFRNTLGA